MGTIKWVPARSVNRHASRATPIHTVTVFANSSAGKGAGGEIARSLASRLQSDGFQVRTLLDSPASAARPEGQCDAAIVIGGDGTLRAVVKAYLQANLPTPAILPIPMGTANLMGRHLGIDWSGANFAGRVAESLRQGRLAHLDVAAANGEPFLLVAGVGIDASIVHEVDRLRKGPINYAKYFLPAARTLISYEYPSLEVHLDGRLVFPSAPAVAFIGNVSQYGTGFAMLPDARPDDGLLDLAVIPVNSRGEAIRKFLLSAAGEHLLDEGVVHARGRDIRVSSPETVPVQIDGDPAGHTPAVFNLLPARLAFIVPA